jgi:hypothetical protein
VFGDDTTGSQHTFLALDLQDAVHQHQRFVR